MISLPQIAFDDLARYSSWPARLLDPGEAVRSKSIAEVQREFNQDKWGALLEFARTAENFSLEMVEGRHVDPLERTPYVEDATFYLATAREALERHLDLYARTLAPYANTATCLVELGAGFGSKILRLARRPEFAHLPLVAAEYTSNGQELIRLIARGAGTKIDAGYCDFRELTFDPGIPKGALIFTSYSVHYVPELSGGFVSALSGLQPSAVVHFEPCYEHHSTESVYGLMCRRYAELNDYTRNLGSLIDQAAAAGKITARVRKNVLGSNPFLPISVIEWTPL